MKRYLPIAVVDSPLALSSFQLDLAWGPLAQHSPAHRWVRRIIIEEARRAARESHVKVCFWPGLRPSFAQICRELNGGS